MIQIATEDSVRVIEIDRVHRRNAVDRATAEALAEAFREFDRDAGVTVAILKGAGEHFCAGADLKAVAEGRPNRLEPSGDGPMGPTRMLLSKPVIAAIEGYCVAGGLELACWCDLRVAARDAKLGVLCRRVGVPLIDGGTIRLPRLIGQSRAMDMILTGRLVDAAEAADFGLVNYLTEPGQALQRARDLALSLTEHPQICLRSDRMSVYEQWGMSPSDALANEFTHGLKPLAAGEAVEGATRFTDGGG